MTYEQRINSFKNKFHIGSRLPRAIRPVSRRSYSAAALNRLTMDWNVGQSSGDSEIRYDICSLIARSRELEREEGLLKKILDTGEKNVVGPQGFRLQNKAENTDGTLALSVNRKVERAWKEWIKSENCTVAGDASLADVCNLAMRSTMRDGGILIRKIIDPDINEFGFALQMIEIDHLDFNYNVAPKGGNRIIMGVEKDGYYRTVAYHVFREHPGDLLFGARVGERPRIPAREIVHYFLRERVSQCVGVPWGAPAMLRMHHLQQYELAELIASRAASNKGGYFTSDRGDKYAGENEQVQGELGTVTTGTFNDSEPGQYDELPAGMTFEPYDPTHPTQQYGDFVVSQRLGIIAPFGMSYATVIGDLTRASFSSMRTGRMDEIETYKKMQAHMVEHLLKPIFSAWLEMAITSGVLDLPIARIKQFNQPVFVGRKWDWFDPLKDIQAKLLEVAAGLRPLASVIEQSDSDLDLEQTFDQLAYEQELAEEKHLKLKVADAQVGIQETEPEPDDAQLMLNGAGRNGHRK